MPTTDPGDDAEATATATAHMPSDTHRLHLTGPAIRFEEGLPVGNGSLGAMALGDATRLRLILNDDTAWSGSPASADAPGLISPDDAREALARARRAVDDGDHLRAGDEVRRFQHRHSQTYLPYATISLDVAGPDTARADDAESTDRVLDLRTATATVTGGTGGTGGPAPGTPSGTDADPGTGASAVVHRTWVSHPHQVLVHRLTTPEPRDVTVDLTSPLRILRHTRRDGPDGTCAVVHLQMPADIPPAHDDAPDPVVYDDRPGAALRGALVARVLHDGTAAPADDGQVRLTGATRVTLVVATATSYDGPLQAPRGDEHDAELTAADRVAAALDAGLDAVRHQQIADHAALYDRAALDVPGPARAGDTPARLAAINTHDVAHPDQDPALIATLFHYGRYLLICSSRPGSLPATLQGLWNAELRPPWSSNYTTNINLQMNYWAAHTTGLAETEDPLVDLVRALAATGRRTARRLYGTRGWVAHHNTDAWAYSLPVGAGQHAPRWAFGPLAGLWLLRHLPEHAAFAPDDSLLTDTWDLLRDAAAFALDWLVPGADGRWGTNPSTSPENTFRTPAGQVADVAASSAFDLDLIGDHLRLVVALADRWGLEDPVVEQARRVLPQVRRPHTGRTGAVAEWDGDPDQDDPHHRHLSPLVSFFPGLGGFDDGSHDAERADAVRQLLDERGDESTGWSLAWKIALRARLRDPAAVDRLLRLVFRDMTRERGPWSGGLYPNFFAAHPPFQIDGNLGFTAGLAEALLQSHRGEIEVLPALPAALPRGRVHGLVARPGISVEIAWDRADDGGTRLECVRLTAQHARAAGRHRVRWGSRTAEVMLDVGTAADVTDVLLEDAA